MARSRRELIANVIRRGVDEELVQMLADEDSFEMREFLKTIRRLLPLRVRSRFICDDYEALKIEDIMLGHKRRCRSLAKDVTS